MSTSIPIITSVFNPSLLSDDDLVRSFVARQPLLERMLDDIRNLQPHSVPQHQLIIGQRGMGKTTLLRRIAIAVRQEAALTAFWIPLEFPEEQYNVKNLGDFWLNCADALSDALDKTGLERQAATLDHQVAALPRDSEARSAAAFNLLISTAESLGHGLILLVDNIDIILDRLDKNEEWKFRRILSEHPLLYFIGGSSRALEAFYEHGRAFFDFFNVHELKSFNDEDMFSLLNRLAEQGHNEEVKRITCEQPARIRALRVLTGGNPRTLVLLYRVLSQGPDGDVRRDIEQLLDTYTPLYKARFEEMAPQAQQVVDCMAIHWDPISAAEISEKLNTLPVNQVSAQLKRLEDFGIVEKTPRYGDKKTAFQVAERFFNIWYLMRASRRERRKLIWLVRFLEAWFEPNDLEQYAEALLRRDISSADEAEIRLLISQIISNKPLSRSLASSGLKTALTANVRGQFDFSGLPTEVLVQKDRMELLRHLEHSIQQVFPDRTQALTVWRLVGGSPFLTLQEKSDLVLNKLPALDQSARQSILDKLGREQRRLIQSFPDRENAVERLYRAINEGEMAEPCDIDGALSLERPTYNGWLPVIALASQISEYCSPARMDADRIQQVNKGITQLEKMSAYTAPAAMLKAMLLRLRLLNLAEAEAAYKDAINRDSGQWQFWMGLGSMLNDIDDRKEEALDALEKAHQINPNAASVLYHLGNAFLNLGQYPAAEEAFRGALELDPEAAYVHIGLGRLLEGNPARYPDAEACYREALKLEPESEYGWNVLANFLGSRFESKRLDEAADAYRHTIEINPTNPVYLADLGNLLVDHSEETTEAETVLRKALVLDEKSYWAWVGLAKVMFMQGRLAEFVHAVFRIYEYGTKDLLKFRSPVDLIRNFVKIERAPAAILQTILDEHERCPEDRDISFLLVEVLVINDKWERSRIVLEQLLEDSGEDHQPVIHTFTIMVQRGHVDEVIALLERTGANERWRPLYEALRAYREGTADYLLRVAPEIRVIAQTIFDKFASADLERVRNEEGASAELKA